ncbi:hypothetical protein BK123_33590 [Paenibacillus lautus]|uniref:Uncharacterized protein n=1 Tax=Paenibacillus lautus TaxID=1401 RepID=A0A1R1AH81_PAELA|nr:hypothetical protein BK123_33590 [Paenibacillus lautus]
MRFVVQGHQSERSATVIWGSVETLSCSSVMWNAFPLHPFEGQGKNRTSKREDLDWGITILQLVIDLFPGMKVVSVGKKAKSSCRKLRIKTIAHLNHPHRADIFREQFDFLFPNRYGDHETTFGPGAT